MFMKLISSITVVLGIVFALSSCTRQLLGNQVDSTATENFDRLWADYDEHYGTFISKDIDWNAAYAKYRPMVYDGMPDSALFRVMKELLDVLDDNHVFLKPLASTGLHWYKGGILGRIKVQDYDRELAQSYLVNMNHCEDAIDYGMLPGNIGYINLKKLDHNYDFYPGAMDDVLEALQQTKGIVIDMRENDGGEDRVSQYIANRFASAKHLSFSSRLRNGPAHSDFAAPIKFYTEPQGKFQYTKPVILINNRLVYSAGETFVLAMLQNDNVQLIGTVTGGALSDAVERELPNGWLYRVPIADVRDANGLNLEQKGIEPSVYVDNSPDDLQAGKDKMLEKAIDLLH